MASKKIATVGKECVACGNCVNVCRVEAIRIQIRRGISAVVDETKCVGCGKCEKACPASVIEIIVRDGQAS